MCLLLSSCFKEPKKEVSSEVEVKDIATKKTDTSETSSTNIKSKASILTLENLVEGTVDNFENWASLNNFHFIKKQEFEFWHNYLYTNFETKTDVIFNTRSNKYLYAIVYQTLNKKEFEELKKYCEKWGYAKNGTEGSEPHLIYYYTKDNIYELSFSSETVNYKNVYSIALEKLDKK